MSGFVKLYRGWQDNPALVTAERKVAWIWLIENAVWKDSLHNIQGKTAPILRGQLCVSRAQLSKAWGWSGSAVERFLTRLETEQMIGRETGQGKTIITVCNYNKYQDNDREAGQLTGQEAGQQSDSHRTTKEEGIRKKEEKNILPRKKKHRIPDDFSPSSFGEKTQSQKIISQWSQDYFNGQFEKFRAHHTAKGTLHENWQSAWSTWVLNSVQFSKFSYADPEVVVGI